MPSIARLSHRHVAIADWLIAHPDRPLSECAAAFHVSRSWLSCIIHSDAFQEYLKARQADAFGVAIDLRDKVAGVAEIALERLLEKLQVEEDTNTLISAADKALAKLDYGRKGPDVAIQTNIYQASPEQLEDARARVRKLYPPASTTDAKVSAGGEG